jgi:hypothetical protein
MRERVALSALGLAVALLTGCAANGGPTLPASTASRISSDAKSKPLLYVSDLNSGDVSIFSYPRGKPEGTLTGFAAPHGLCVDKSGDVFVTSLGSGQIFEFAHGGTKPIAVLNDKNYSPNGCSVDPVTGDLAVANITPARSGGGGSVSIFKQARGKPKIYTISSLFFYYFCGYDANGNLFVDGTNYHIVFGLAELPAGGTTLIPIGINQSIRYPGGVQWDGTHLAIGDQYYLSGPSVVYEFSISGTEASRVGTTQLSDSCDVLQFWVDGKRLIAPDDCSPYVKYFAYPAGGDSTKSISDASQPVGVVVSP